MKVVDAFIYNGELPQLKLRLAELAPIVDRFVIVEADRTFTGLEKPYYFAEQAAQLDKDWLKKVLYDACELPLFEDDPWQAEKVLRDEIEVATAEYSDDDYILVSDVDEIPSAKAVEKAVKLEGVIGIVQRLSYYWLNCVCDYEEPYTRGAKLGYLRDVGGNQFRRWGKQPYSSEPLTRWIYGGWHFSCQGGVLELQRKLRSFSHTELCRPPYTDLNYLRECMVMPRDLLDRPTHRWRFVPLDETFPKYLQEHAEEFIENLWMLV